MSDNSKKILGITIGTVILTAVCILLTILLPKVDSMQQDAQAIDDAMAPILDAISGESLTSPTDSSTRNVVAIAEWVDLPGVCPLGTRQVDIKTALDLQQATRGEGKFAIREPQTCYFIRDGIYKATTPFELNRTDGKADDKLLFIGESRNGVKIKGTNWLHSSHVVMQNVSFDLTGMTTAFSFTTLTVDGSSDLTMDRVTFTGDCKAGGVGGHIELLNVKDVTLNSMIVEKFGDCSGGKFGGRDQGVYIESGENIVLRNSIIRENSSRGIQLYTGDGEYGTLTGVRILNNRIYNNGHKDFQDGIVISGSNGGTISNVLIQNNLIYDNYYSGIRFLGPDTVGILIQYNTFKSNTKRSSYASRSVINVDENTDGRNAIFTKNIIVDDSALLNYCPKHNTLLIEDNIVFSVQFAPNPCIASVIAEDPMLDATMAPSTSKAAGYGAYARP